MGVLLRLWGFWWFSGIPLLAALASPFAKRKGRETVCFVFTLGSRVRGNDGACGNDGVVRGDDGVVRGNDGVVRGDGRGW